jgi:hypothetical protein
LLERRLLAAAAFGDSSTKGSRRSGDRSKLERRLLAAAAFGDSSTKGSRRSGDRSKLERRRTLLHWAVG